MRNVACFVTIVYYNHQVVMCTSVFVNYITTTRAGNGTAAGSWVHYNNNSYICLLMSLGSSVLGMDEWTTGES